MSIRVHDLWRACTQPRRALQNLQHWAAGGRRMSDDVHLHPARDDFCAQHRLRPTRVERLGVTRNHLGAA
jgi:hypothetical protein